MGLAHIPKSHRSHHQPNFSSFFLLRNSIKFGSGFQCLDLVREEREPERSDKKAQERSPPWKQMEMLRLCTGRKLLCLAFMILLPEWLSVTEGQGQGQGQAAIGPPVFTEEPDPDPTTPEPVHSDAGTTHAADCREDQFPCTRIYSVQKPITQCIRHLCVTSVRRVYVINKEVCSRIMCKEDEKAQDEICRQLSGIPLRRSRRSNNGPCKRARREPRAPRIH